MESLSSPRRRLEAPCAGVLCRGLGPLLGLFVVLSFALPPAVAQEAPKGFREEATRIRQIVYSGDYRKAARRAEALVKKYPEEAAAWMVLASCHMVDTWSSRLDARALEAAMRARELAGDRPDILFAIATCRFRQRQDDALPLLDELLEKRPSPYDRNQQSKLLVMRASLILRGENQDLATRQKAFEDLARILAMDSRHAGARQLRADALREDGKYEEALADLEVVRAQVPGNKQVHYSMSACYRGLRNIEKARHHLQIWKLIHKLTDSIAQTSAPDLEERLAILRELRELNPDDVNRRLELVQMELMVGDLDRAEVEWKSLKDRHPEWAPLGPLKTEIDRRRQEAADDGDGS